MHFINSCRKKIQLKSAYIPNSHFCFAFLRINFSSCKEKWFEQLKCEDKQNVVGQVMAPEKNVCLFILQLRCLQAHLSCHEVLLLESLSEEMNREEAVLYPGKRTGNYDPGSVMASRPRWGYYIYCNLCPNLCSETRRVVSPCAVWSFRGCVAAELADRRGILMPVLLLPKMKTRLLQQRREIFFSVWYEYHT